MGGGDPYLKFIGKAAKCKRDSKDIDCRDFGRVRSPAEVFVPVHVHVCNGAAGFVSFIR